MKNSGTLSITAQGDREIVMTRDFSAPRELVFDALTKPEMIKRWLGVFGGWTMEICEVDLREGGSYRYFWRRPDGASMGMRGVYREIAAPERIVNTEVFDEPWYPGEAVGTALLTERDGRTTLTTTVVYDSREIRDAVLKSPMEHGVRASYDNMEEMLGTLVEVDQ